MKNLSIVKWYAPIAVIVFAMIMTAFGFQPNKAYANSNDADALPFCTASNLSNWDWPDWIQQNNTLKTDGTSVAGGLPNFDYNTSSYIITGTEDEGTGTNTYQMYDIITPNNQSQTLTLGEDTSLHDYAYTNGSTSTLYQGLLEDPTIFHNPPAVSYLPSESSWGVDDGYSDINIATLGSYADNLVYTIGGSPANYQPCIEAVHNVNYDTTWIGGAFETPTLGYTNQDTPGSDTSCPGGLAGIACTVGKVFSGVADDILAAIKALANAIGDIFLPNGDQLSQDWSGFALNMESHLGFLLWPFTFIGQLYTALTTPSASDCDLTGATFFGRTMPSIDLCAPETSLGSLWTYMTYLVRAVLIIGLFFYLKNKFQEIATK